MSSVFILVLLIFFYSNFCQLFNTLYCPLEQYLQEFVNSHSGSASSSLRQFTNSAMYWGTLPIVSKWVTELWMFRTVFPLIAFHKNNVPGAKHLYNFPEDYSITQHIRRLKCRGLPVCGNTSNLRQTNCMYFYWHLLVTKKTCS